MKKHKILAISKKIARLYEKAHSQEFALQQALVEALNIPEESIFISYLHGDGVAVMNPKTDTGTSVEDFIKQAESPDFDVKNFFTSL